MNWSQFRAKFVCKLDKKGWGFKRWLMAHGLTATMKSATNKHTNSAVLSRPHQPSLDVFVRLVYCCPYKKQGGGPPRLSNSPTNPPKTESYSLPEAGRLDNWRLKLRCGAKRVC